MYDLLWELLMNNSCDILFYGHLSNNKEAVKRCRKVQYMFIVTWPSLFCIQGSAGFTYRLDRLQPMASNFRGPSAKVYIIFITVIGLSHLCCHSVLYFLNNPSVIFLTQLHSISEYCRILSTPHHLCFYWKWLSTLPSSSSHEGGELGVASQVD
jgi:hypothetical protein